jgi:hypothetical protein
MKTVLIAAVVAGNALAQDGVLPVTVENAAGKGRNLELRLDLRGGKVAGAVGKASFTRSPAELDVTGLSVSDGQVAGDIKVNIVSDGYAAAINFICKVEAPIAGKLQPRPAASEVARLTLNCENIVTHVAGKGGSRRLQLVFATRDGKAFTARAIPPGSMTDVAFATRVTRCAITSVDGKLDGDVEVTLQPQNSEAKPIVYVYTIAGRAIGDLATGQVATKCDGRAVNDVGTFVGNVRNGAPETGNALYKLALHDALGIGKFLDLYLSTKDGKFIHGFGTGPNFNNATHDVDITKLKLDGNKLTGNVAVTVLPDPWIPKDHKPIACVFEVEATVDGGEVTGKYSGTAGANKISSALDGGLDAKPAGTALMGGTVKLEAGLMGDAGYHSRAFVTFTAKDGKVTGGKLWNNHSKLAGTVDGGEVKLVNERLTAKIQATVTVGAGSKEGKYEFEVDTLMVGTAGAGGFTTRMGEEKRTGRLWAVVKME